MSDILSWIRLPGPFLVGHRGFCGVPGAEPSGARENTLAAFRAAVDIGCDGVELDVRVTGDGVPVVHHDADVSLGGEAVRIAESKWADLEHAVVGDTGAGGYRIHTLDEVLRELSGRCLLNVEIKPDPKRTAAITAMIYGRLNRVRPRESLLVSSFDAGILEALSARDHAVALGYIFKSLREFNTLEQEPVVDALTSIHPHHGLVDAKLLKRASERGLQVHAWTADEPVEIARLIDLDVAAVITNRPDLALQL